MKLKCRPEDFRVVERLDLQLKRTGPFSIYRLEKRNWNTLDVIRHLQKRHHLRRIGRAGLKDRYSLSTQYLSVSGPGPDEIREQNYTLTLVGRSAVPVTRELVEGNEFTITLRALQPPEAESIRASVPLVASHGFPNYYDDQRLGSARHGQGFIARRLIDGHYNGALKLYAAATSGADDSKTRRRKTELAARWGDWPACVRLVPAEARPAFEHLARRPTDFRGAVAALPLELLQLFLNAYQSWIFNETLTGLLRSLGVPTREVPYQGGRLSFYRSLSPEQERQLAVAEIAAAAPDARFRSERIGRVMTDVLAREGLTLDSFRLRLRVRGLYFKGYSRTGLTRPERLLASEPCPDDLYPGRVALTLSFALPPGSFATILVKRLAL
jgi:tRNA pseudouridine13 synthase